MRKWRSNFVGQSRKTSSSLVGRMEPKGASSSPILEWTVAKRKKMRGWRPELVRKCGETMRRSKLGRKSRKCAEGLITECGWLRKCQLILVEQSCRNVFFLGGGKPKIVCFFMAIVYLNALGIGERLGSKILLLLVAIKTSMRGKDYQLRWRASWGCRIPKILKGNENSARAKATNAGLAGKRRGQRPQTLDWQVKLKSWCATAAQTLR